MLFRAAAPAVTGQPLFFRGTSCWLPLMLGGHNTRPNSRESGGAMWLLLLHTGPTACRPARPARGHNVAVCHTRHTTSLNAMTTSLPLVTRTDAGDTCSCFWVDSR